MTILQQLQSAFPDVEGIGDARNIAEALAMISGAGGRGANAIADKVSNPGGGEGGGIDAYAQYDFSEAIGSSASYIGGMAFYYCPNLTTASFPNVSSIGLMAFANCTSLTNVSFPNASYIGSTAFAGCSSLTSVSFPNASYIGSSAFVRCSSLTSVSVPNANYIGSNAFQYCNNLISLYLTGGSLSQVPTLGEFVFHDTPIVGYSEATSEPGSVYVPASLYSAFLTADNWSSIASRIVSVSES